MTVQRRGAAIDIAGLRKEYVSAAGSVLALDNIDLKIAAGEFICIVGPSGCGKSTLLRILAGLDHQTSGTITVHAEGWAVENAMVFQESGLFPWMNVETNVGFGLMTRGVPARRGRGADRRRAQARRPHQIPAALSASALRRHAASERDRARLRDQSGDAADGRAVRRARRAEPRHPAGRAGAALGADRQDRDLHHAFDRGGAAARRPLRGDDGAARPHQGDHQRAVRRTRATSLRCRRRRTSAR